ncbi:MAG TPA: DUF4347 domain-containing protein, partial [Leptolyngbyaceae cyanobacterium]
MPHSCLPPSADCQQDKVFLPSNRTLVVIDSRVSDVDLLVGGVQPGAMVRILNPNQDGVEQITAILQQYPNIAAIHLVSHGQSCALQLGNTELSSKTLNSYTDQFSLWSKLLASNAQLLLYSCEVAKGDRGKSFIHDLSNRTGATIAASTTKVGDPAQGGNWCLKATTAPMIVQHAFFPSTLERYKAILGTEFRVNEFTENEQYHSSVTHLADGGFVVTWSSSGQDGSGWGIYGQRYDASGNPAGSEFLINTTRTNDQDYSSVTGLTNGSFVVTWSSLGQDGDGYGMYGQRYDASGSPAGSEFLINTNTISDQISSSLASLSDGGFVVIWSSSGQDGSGWGIYGQRYDASGNPIGSEFLINTNTIGDQISSSVASLSDGGFVVTWSSSGQDGSGWGIYGQRYDASGNPAGSEFPINTNTTGDQDYSSVTSLTNGGFVVAWLSGGKDIGDPSIYVQRYDSNGNPVDKEFQVNTTTPPQSFSIAGPVNDGFAVAWSSFEQDGSGYGIYGRRYDASGDPAGDELLVKQITKGDQWNQILGAKSVAVLPNDNLVVTWCGSTLGDDSGVFARILQLPVPDLGGNDNTNEPVVNLSLLTTTADNNMTVATLSVTDASTLTGNVGIGTDPGTEKLKVTGYAAIDGPLSVTGNLTIGSGNNALDVRDALAAKANTTELDALKEEIQNLKIRLQNLSENSESSGVVVESAMPSEANTTSQDNSSGSQENAADQASLANQLDELQHKLNELRS